MNAPKGLLRSMRSLIGLMAAMAHQMSRQVAVVLEDETPAPQPCPIKTAVEFGLSVPRKRSDGSKKIFY